MEPSIRLAVHAFARWRFKPGFGNVKDWLSMMQNPQPATSLFTKVDIAAAQPVEMSIADEPKRLLHEILRAQDRQNELLEELVGLLGAQQRQRNTELGQWKQANPRLAKGCRVAAEALTKVQAEFLQSLTEEVSSNSEDYLDSDFLLNE